MELAFRALPEHELRSADVAVISLSRFEATDEEDKIHGAPELVIEILPPSNTASEMKDREELCLANGSAEFRVVDPKGKTIRCAARNLPATVYRAGDAVPLDRFGDRELEVARVFDTDHEI